MKRAGASILALGALLFSSQASAREEGSYLPWWLRGDGVLVVQRSSRATSRFEGPGGTLRYRKSRSFAWETGFAYLRGIDDAKATSIPTFGRATFIDSDPKRPDWDFYLALGSTFEWSTETSRYGAEIALGVDRRIDPIWNRFLVELAFDERMDLDHHEHWTPAVMLRIGIATTFGIRKYQ